MLNIHNFFTTTYHPQTNVQAEWFSRTLKAANCSYLSDRPANWDLHAPSLAYKYSCLPHKSTASGAFELVLSRSPPLLALNTYLKKYPTPQEAKNKWKQWSAKSLCEARARLNRAE